jgi:hypothetical protein
MKKQGFTFGLILTIFVIVFSSCTRDQSTVEGQITYIGAISGIEYSADGAAVELDHLSYDNGIVYTDENGNYIFENVLDGEYRVKASITVNGITYSGISSSFTLSGDDYETINLILE